LKPINSVSTVLWFLATGALGIAAGSPLLPAEANDSVTHFRFEKKGPLISRPQGMPKPGPYYTTLVDMKDARAMSELTEVR